MQTTDTPLITARRRDVGRRRARVHKAITDMHGDGSEITIAATAMRAGVHRSFIHRHDDLRAAVLAAAAETIDNPSPAATTVSYRSVLAENANLHASNGRLSQRIRDLEECLSESLGQHAFERSGLGAPTSRQRHCMTTLNATSNWCSIATTASPSSKRSWPRPARPTVG
jgi:hypothetical protein